MSRIQECFKLLRQQQKTALIPYLIGGHPDPSITVNVMHAMVSGGADIIELGVPFSDPMADGPVIQRGSELALEKHVSLKDVLSMAGTFREQNTTTPIVIMTYLTPIEVLGYQRFLELAVQSGIDGVLVVDMPPEEGAELKVILQQARLDMVHLIAPTTELSRMKTIGASSSGYVYYVSLRGVTGAANLDIADVEKKLAEIRSMVNLPIAVGFGIKDAETAKKVGGLSDGIIIGSAIVQMMHDMQESPEEIPALVKSFITTIRESLDLSN